MRGISTHVSAERGRLSEALPCLGVTAIVINEILAKKLVKESIRRILDGEKLSFGGLYAYVQAHEKTMRLFTGVQTVLKADGPSLCPN